MIHITLSEALASPPTPGSLAATLAQFPGVILEFYAPVESDPQEPHTRDEIYVIARGSGKLLIGGRPHPFVAGDVFYVPAHTEHMFMEFSSDFGTWVLFYGPEVP
jgi:mannose-6-phosphate isomerase-like protein (cupin superfamily)